MSENAKVEINTKDLRIILQKFNEDLGHYINEEQRYRLGRVLTIVDAAIADPEQRKAIKDLVNNEWWGDRGYRVSDDGMNNPHSDIRAICKILGFELYPASESQGIPAENENLEWQQKKYKDAIATKR